LWWNAECVGLEDRLQGHLANKYITAPASVKPFEKAREPRPKKLLEQVSDAIRLKHYSPRIEESCVHWIKRFIPMWC